MERHELTELHYITPIGNLTSIMTHGVLNHQSAQQHNPVSVALQDVQDIRAGKKVPEGLRLHEYVNLYICARNPMLYKRLPQRHELCVLQVAPAVLDIEGAVITDMNAASRYVRFYPSPSGLSDVDGEMVFAKYWSHPDDPVAYFRHSAIKCAEVLVPHCVGPEHILRAYVCSHTPKQAIAALDIDLTVSENRYMFFDQS